MFEVTARQAFYMGQIFQEMSKFNCSLHTLNLMRICQVPVKTDAFMQDLAVAWALLYGASPNNC